MAVAGSSAASIAPLHAAARHAERIEALAAARKRARTWRYARYAAIAALVLWSVEAIVVGDTDWSRISALKSDDLTRQASLRAQLALLLTPKTSAAAGVRYRELRSNVTPEGREGSVFIGLDHRM